MTNLDGIFKSRYYFANKGPSIQGYGFSCGHVWMWELDCKESWALKNWCFWTVVLEKTFESPLDCKEIQPVHSEGDQSWDFFGKNDAKAETPVLWPSCEELTHWKRLWCWEGLGARGEGDDRGWDGWMASLTRWTWVWVNSGSWWWTGRPGVLRFMGLQRVRHDWATDLLWSDVYIYLNYFAVLETNTTLYINYTSIFFEKGFLQWIQYVYVYIRIYVHLFLFQKKDLRRYKIYIHNQPSKWIKGVKIRNQVREIGVRNKANRWNMHHQADGQGGGTVWLWPFVRLM